MAFRSVTAAFRDSNGNTVALSNPGEQWSPRTASDVIDDIVSGVHHYVVDVPGSPRVDVHVVDGPQGRYVRTTGDDGADNNLDLLREGSVDYLPTYLGNHPDEEQTDWSENLQGVTHSSDHWFFTQLTRIVKFHVTTDLASDTHAASAEVSMPPELASLDCNHFGDPEFLEWNGHRYLFVPVEGDGGDCGSNPRLAVFEDHDAGIDFVGAAVLSQQTAALGGGRAGWCAIDPETLLLHSSHNRIDETFPVFRYNVDFDALEEREVILEPAPSLRLHQSGAALSIPQYLQGGCFSPRGHLYLMNGKLADRETLGGIRVFDRDGTFLFRSSVSSQPFKYEYHSGWTEGSEEPEGLTFWDVDALPAPLRPPNIAGQLHAILLDQDAISSDDYYLKHYRVPS